MIKNYEKKWAYLMRRQKSICPIAKAKKGWAELPNELHHRHPRSELGKKKFPLFIDSLWNLMAVNHDFHMSWPSFAKIRWLEAEKRQKFLERHPDIAKKLNMED